MDTNCSICHKPVLDGQAIYTITNNHYDCEWPNGRKTLTELSDEADEQLAKINGMIDTLKGMFTPERPKRSVAAFYPRCEHCGCKLARRLGDPEGHAADCPNLPL